MACQLRKSLLGGLGAARIPFLCKPVFPGISDLRPAPLCEARGIYDRHRSNNSGCVRLSGVMLREVRQSGVDDFPPPLASNGIQLRLVMSAAGKR